MRINFALPTDNQRHDYCWFCKKEALQPVRRGQEQWFACKACGKEHPRAIIIDPEVKYWFDTKKEYWHEVAGIFVCNPDGAFLFFDRTRFPFGKTVPAGHVNRREKPAATAERELFEEVGIKSNKLCHLATDTADKDSCRRGADIHRWHTFGLKLVKPVTVVVGDEGDKPVWLTLEQAKRQKLTPVTRFVLEKYSKTLQRLARQS